MQTQTNLDRRRHERVPYGAWVEDLSQSGSLRFHLTRNLSRGGLLLVSQSNDLPPLGSQVRLRLVVENEERVFTVDGTVVRHGRDGTGTTLFAVQFVGLDAPSGEFLQQLLSEIRPQPA